MKSAVTSIVILLALSALHAYWAAGGTFGKGATIPEQNGQPILKPSAVSTYFIAACLVLASALIAMCVDLLPSAALGPLPRFATRALAVIFAVRAIGDFRYVGFFKRVRGTRFARLDRAFYSPLCCVLALLIAYVAYTTTRKP